MATIKVKCLYCGSEEAVRYGRNSKTGRERFLYKNLECARKVFWLEYKNNPCKPGMREKIVEMMMNGSRTRDTGRVLGVSKDTVTKVLKNEKIRKTGQRSVSERVVRKGRKTGRGCGDM